MKEPPSDRDPAAGAEASLFPIERVETTVVRRAQAAISKQVNEAGDALAVGTSTEIVVTTHQSSLPRPETLAEYTRLGVREFMLDEWQAERKSQRRIRTVRAFTPIVAVVCVCAVLVFVAQGSPTAAAVSTTIGVLGSLLLALLGRTRGSGVP